MKKYTIESISDAPLSIAGVGRLQKSKKAAASEKAAKELFIDARARKAVGKEQIVVVCGPDGKPWDLNRERPWIEPVKPPPKIIKKAPAPKPPAPEEKKEK